MVQSEKERHWPTLPEQLEQLGSIRINGSDLAEMIRQAEKTVALEEEERSKRGLQEDFLTGSLKGRVNGLREVASLILIAGRM